MGIFEPCRWVAKGARIPTGSRGRLDRALKGKHPDTTAKHWPDGRCAKIVMKI